MFFEHLRDLSFIWPFREANTRIINISWPSEKIVQSVEQAPVFIFGKNCRLLFVCFVCFVCCNTLSDFG